MSNAGSIQSVVAGGYYGDYGNVFTYRGELTRMLEDLLEVSPIVYQPKYSLGSTSVYLQTRDKVITVVDHYYTSKY